MHEKNPPAMETLINNSTNGKTNEYRVNPSAIQASKWINFFLGGFGFIVFLPGLVIFALNGSEVAATAMTFGALVLGLLLVCFRSVKKLATTRIEMDDESVIFSVFGQSTKMEWKELDSLQVTAVKLNGAGISLYTFELKSRLGETIHFSYTNKQISNILDLQVEMERQVVSHHLNSFADRLNNFETIDFGKIQLSKEGVHFGSKLLALSEIEAIQVENGRIAYVVAGQPISFGIHTVGSIPNYCLFDRLLKSMIGH